MGSGGVGWGGVVITFMFFLAVLQTQALLFHDQLLGWGGVWWGGVRLLCPIYGKIKNKNIPSHQPDMICYVGWLQYIYVDIYILRS